MEKIQINEYFKLPLSNKDFKNGQYVLSYNKRLNYYESG